MNNWVELLPNAEYCLNNRYKEIRRIQNTILLNDEVLNDANRIKILRKNSQLKKENKVYLYINNLKTRKLFKKLNHVKVGLFLIDKQPVISDEIRRVSYRLRLPKDAKMHSVFYVRYLEPVYPDILLQETFYLELDNENEYEVERILDHGPREYLIKWKEYPPD